MKTEAKKHYDSLQPKVNKLVEQEREKILSMGWVKAREYVKNKIECTA
jgi:hypothetical protein